MSMTVHNLMAFNQQYFRPVPPLAPKRENADEKSQSFQAILNEKMNANASLAR
ncbi:MULTISPECIES: hypothetical protein [Paenibacillus]|uniref:hypothetical protein n=1 Tax=Paenibacillus TaxID=44249 RepID=UPI00168B0A37|nr:MULTISPECIES: hypothetical protein [Paenibacillus]